jgi:predicted Rossmann fold nucleotide-binding protein DprA/Smf involved in DNA uptake
VLRSLRVDAPSLGRAAECLRARGHWAEALALEEAGLLGWAEGRVAAGEVLTAECEAYPARWLDVLGVSAPPALWRRGQVPPGPFLSVVGSREIGREVRAFCSAVAAEAARLDYSVVSGGAAGCDRAAARGCPAGRLLEVLPCGLRLRGDSAGCQLSVCGPDEEFSTGTAMERNALIYGASEFTVVGQARFREGGTWTGAVDARRRGLTRLIVRDSGDQASRALFALGAIPLGRPDGLATALNAPSEQPRLFDGVRERRAAYSAA